MRSVAGVLSGTDRWTVETADAVAFLGGLPDSCVHCCVSSPPYFSLRDYGVAGQIGLEDTPDAYVARLVEVFREVRRVLHPTGTLWLNLGDSYSGGAGGRGDVGNIINARPTRTRAVGNGRIARDVPNGLKAKDLIGIPWMTAFALRGDGWYLRQHCPWVKRNPMPESVQDRPGTACEEVFLLAKTGRYFFDMEAVKRAGSVNTSWKEEGRYDTRDKAQRDGQKSTSNTSGLRTGESDSRNLRNSDLWFDSVGLLLASDTSDDMELLGLDVTTKPYKRAHFAVMPKALVRPLIAAGTSEKGVCPKCSAPWTRQVKRERKATRPGENTKVAAAVKSPAEEPGRTSGPARFEKSTLNQITGNRDPERHCTVTETLGWLPGCKCAAGEPIPALVLDPFMGSGTVAAVAVDMGRRAIGCELNPKYLDLIRRRMSTVTPTLFGGAS